jgi:hypothetical protein
MVYSLTTEKIAELSDLFEQFQKAVKRLFLEAEYYFSNRNNVKIKLE